MLQLVDDAIKEAEGAFAQNSVDKVEHTNMLYLPPVPRLCLRCCNQIRRANLACHVWMDLYKVRVSVAVIGPSVAMAIARLFVCRAVKRNTLLQHGACPRRFLMDAKTRPSHSRMFVAKETKPPTPKSLPSATPAQDPTPEWQVYLVIAQRIALAWGMIHVFTEYGMDITLCEGPSMMPTIHEYGEMLLVDKLFMTMHGVRDGDTVKGRAHSARRRQEDHIPSVLWHEPMLPRYGDDYSWMEAWNHLLFLPLSIGDVVVADHPSRPGTICKRVAALPGDQVMLRNSGRLETVPNGHVWLEGDNARQSNDSRHYGPIPLALLKGRAIARIWPLRGSAWMKRLRNRNGSTVLPAGYQGEHIARSQQEFEAVMEDPL